MTKIQTVYTNETRLNRLKEWLEFDIEHKIGVCCLCKTRDIVQHQDTCLNCMIDYSKNAWYFSKKLVNRCSMCGQKRKLIEDSNCCNDCLKSII